MHAVGYGQVDLDMLLRLAEGADLRGARTADVGLQSTRVAVRIERLQAFVLCNWLRGEGHLQGTGPADVRL